MKKYFTFLVTIFLLSLSSFSFSAKASVSTEQFETFGDHMQYVLPAYALGRSLFVGDYQGTSEFLEGAFYTAILTHTFKFAVNAERPNGGEHSWPSGHTSATVQPAAFICMRYTLGECVVTSLLAGLTGWSRVESENHYWRDVIAGAGLAIGVQYVVSRTPLGFSNYSFVPIVDNDFLGFSMNYKNEEINYLPNDYSLSFYQEQTQFDGKDEQKYMFVGTIKF